MKVYERLYDAVVLRFLLVDNTTLCCVQQTSLEYSVSIVNYYSYHLQVPPVNNTIRLYVT